MGGNMVRPDMEMVHDETGHIYYMGRRYDVTRMSMGWVLTRPDNTDPIYTGENIDDCLTWLVAQVTY